MPSESPTPPQPDGRASEPAHRFWDIAHAEWDAAVAPAREAEHGPCLHERPLDEFLPAGWRIVSTCPYGDAFIRWHLARRDAGGWVLFSVGGERRQLQFGAAARHLATLYEQNQSRLSNGDGAPMTALRAHVRWYGEVLASLYDPTDPDEAAEQVLFALSGTLRTPPKADR